MAKPCGVCGHALVRGELLDTYTNKNGDLAGRFAWFCPKSCLRCESHRLAGPRWDMCSKCQTEAPKTYEAGTAKNPEEKEAA